MYLSCMNVSVYMYVYNISYLMDIQVTQNCLLRGNSVIANGAPNVYSSLEMLNQRVRDKQVTIVM